MKKKLLSILVGLGIGLGVVSVAVSSPNQCHWEYFECVESGTSERLCEIAYDACRGY